MSTWQLQTAKQRFSEVIRDAERGEPQFITRHGKEVAVIIDISDYRASHEQSPDFKAFLDSIPRGDEPLPIPPRELDIRAKIDFGDDEPPYDPR